MTLLPLKQVMEMARAMASGQYEQRIANPGKDEIGQLATAVNDMALAVQERESRLSELNVSLEQRVIETEEARKTCRTL